MDLLNKHADQAGRGVTYDLWKNFPFHEIFTFKDAHEGIGIAMDPASPPHAPASTSNTYAGCPGSRAFTDAAEYIRGLLVSQHKGGGFRMFTTTDNAAAELQFGSYGEPFIISDTAADEKELILEIAFRPLNITINKCGWFFGLAEAHTLDGDFIADAGTLADLDFVGLFKPEGNTSEVDLVYNKAGAGGVTTHKDGWKEVAAATWYHFGLRYNPKANTIMPWWGTGDRSTTPMAPDATNIITAANIAAATFPDGQGLVPTFALKAAHADDFSLDVRLMHCAQRAYGPD